MFLLDTNILIWMLEDNKIKLGPKIYELVSNEKNVLFVSVVSYWEMVIKTSLGKLKAPDDLIKVVDHLGFNWLKVELDHITQLKALPDIHKDPFDRMLFAQAKSANLTIITADKIAAQYPIDYLLA